MILRLVLIKDKLSSLNIVRLGTSGALQPDIPVDSIVMSTHGLGLDNMLRSYELDPVSQTDIEDAFISHTNWDSRKGRPYVISGSIELQNRLYSSSIFKGITATA